MTSNREVILGLHVYAALQPRNIVSLYPATNVFKYVNENFEHKSDSSETDTLQ